MNTRHFFIGSLALMALVTLASPTLAEVVERRITDEGDSMRFDDEQLLGQDLLANGDLYRLRPPPKRVTLIRPRTGFVTELTKSVEDF